jgi:hypothetical protein
MGLDSEVVVKGASADQAAVLVQLPHVDQELAEASTPSRAPPSSPDLAHGRLIVSSTATARVASSLQLPIALSRLPDYSPAATSVISWPALVWSLAIVLARHSTIAARD